MIVIGTTLKTITDWLKYRDISIIVYTNLYPLYKCLVKLSTTIEKHLMIDIMAL